MMSPELLDLLGAANEKFRALGYRRLGTPVGLTPRQTALNDGFGREHPQIADFAACYELSGDEIGLLWFGSRGSSYEEWIREFEQLYPVENGYVLAASDGFLVFMRRDAPTVYAARRGTDAPEGRPVAPDFNIFLKWACEAFLQGMVPADAEAFADSDLGLWFWRELVLD